MSLTRPALVVLAVGALFLLDSACGRKGIPHPPEDVLPETITDLEAQPTTAGIQLSWGRPRKYTGGGRMTDLGGFLLQRADAPGAPFEIIATVDVTDLERFQQTKRFRYLDAAVEADRTYEYRVVSFTLDRYFSHPSNIVAARREPSPANGDTTGSTAVPE